MTIFDQSNFIIGLILAIAVETSGLHKRIAFRVIMLFGSNPLWLLLGIMSVTGFLSLWISNVIKLNKTTLKLKKN